MVAERMLNGFWHVARRVPDLMGRLARKIVPALPGNIGGRGPSDSSEDAQTLFCENLGTRNEEADF